MSDTSEGPSFDPRTWTAGSAALPAQGRIGRSDAPTPAADQPPSASSARRPPVALAGAAAAAIILAGASVSWLMRDHAPVPEVPRAASTIVPSSPSGPAVDASRRTLVILGLGDLARTLASSGVAADQVRDAVSAANGVAALNGEEGEIRLVLDLVGAAPPMKLTRMEATRGDGTGIALTARPAGGYAAQPLASRLTRRVKVVRGEMDATSFYNAAVAAGITDSLISDFANAFSFDFDFQREIHPGDVFEAAFEQPVNPEGREVGAPSLIYASINTPAKSKALYRFLAPGETEAGWYDGNGRSIVRALMRTPVDGARISSQFGMRMHPVLGFAKMHSGTDFAAPTGTPIYAAGDGVVEWAAMKGPNGNLTILLHDNGWETYYLHQSRFMPGVVPGSRVRQGQMIGAVGTTGRSTGPHLHYEVHVAKKPVDPLGLDYGTGRSLSKGALAAFTKERDRIDAVRAHAVS